MRTSRKLTYKDKEDLLLSLCRAVASIKNSTEAAELIKDIFTENEAEVISKRVEIARLLVDGHTFDHIANGLKVSKGTISRVSVWLSESGDGLRKVIKRTKNEPKMRVAKESWGDLKRQYPKYYWPEILLEQIIASANKKEKERMLIVLNRIKTKTSLYRRLTEILKEDYKRKRFDEI